MIEKDTVKLLRECDAGVKMGVSSIDEVMDYVEARPMREALDRCRNEHNRLGAEIQGRLDRFQDEGKDPSPVIKTMSWMKTNAMLVTTPVIVYSGGQRTGNAVIYQGEQIKANYRVIKLLVYILILNDHTDHSFLDRSIRLRTMPP